MKLLLSALMTAALTGLVLAQTNTPAPNATPLGDRPATFISSDSAEFDIQNRVAIYRGNVLVNDPQMNLKCEQLTAKLPASGGGHMESIVAEHNVVIDMVDDKGRTNQASGDKCVYTYEIKSGATNEVVTLTGNAKLESPDGTLTGEPIIWDKGRNKVFAQNQKMVPRRAIELNPDPSSDKKPEPAATNAPPATP